MPVLAAFLLVATSPLTAPALPDISAIACNACNDAQFEQKALGGGVGQRYYYDFVGKVLRRYEVAHEATDGHGAIWSVLWYAPDPAYKSYFDQAAEYKLHYGTFVNVIVLDLPGAPGSGHSTDSVYDMFGSATSLKQFGGWLGDYLNQAGVPVDPKQAQLNSLITEHPNITFGDDPKRATVKVKFKDGEAYFDLEDAGDEYAFRDGSAYDSEGHRIPANKTEFTTYGSAGNGPTPFPGGPTSNSYLEFLRLANAYGVPITQNSSGWHCGTVSVGGSTRTTCTFG